MAGKSDRASVLYFLGTVTRRRQLLQCSGLFALSSLLPLGIQGICATALGQTSPSEAKKPIVIFFRGGIDGLSVVVPYRDSRYYELRPKIAVPAPQEPEGAIALDSRFGLHPALEPLMSFWERGQLAFIPACGSPDPTRSHFDAQDYMESGTPGEKSTPDGWLNRLLAVSDRAHSTRAVSLGATTPLILKGDVTVANVPVSEITRNLPIDRPRVQAAFDRLYSGSDPLSLAYQEG